MNTTHALPQSRSLGQFFTPPEVVDLAFAILRWLQPDVAKGRLLDPACGEGAFLLGALRAGFEAKRLYGVDADARLPEVWREVFRPRQRPRLAVGDALIGSNGGASARLPSDALAAACPGEVCLGDATSRRVSRRVRPAPPPVGPSARSSSGSLHATPSGSIPTSARVSETVEAEGRRAGRKSAAPVTAASGGRFDVLVGNPPFGIGVDKAQAEHLAQAYRWWRLGRQSNLLKLPRELWFLERSLQLLTPGGLLAMVLPEGVLANHRWQPQRAALLDACQVEAIVGLPRSVFRRSRTTAKTCLLVARHRPPEPGHEVRLAELTDAPELVQIERLLEQWECGEILAEGEPWRTSPS